ncbi:hypothetical protein ASPACDRAFT_44773 [Aspergillus aculeatus ATCC 16872]|uniref:N-acetyltransferase domain-containing protein n=1 Tax=Aspergillus aculeatus (strain ATCC 16872 / CBS 172.66 / WB 5094) TaxID=690307 RepID=A0A1L9WQ46_ASPA1|nr:uncharacterized protein ASPACDRAFT_44773 [Aspergillus aculeatus ATCC 16872]OJJ98268.1 hypothetical protein ASPACDRAFT_44773 [Aspergillus aculeatus ATCC 16872]
MHLETATEADAPALAALYFTCFTNAAHRRIFPPTPEMHSWWTANLRRKIASGRSVVLKMVEWEAEPLPAGIGSAGEGSESGSDSGAAGSGSESGSYAGSDDATRPSSAVGDADADPGVEKESMKGKGRIVAFAEWELPSPSPSPAPAPATPVQSQDQDPSPPTPSTQPQDAKDPNLPPNLDPSDKDLLLRLRAQATRHREEDMRGVEGGYYYLSILGTNPAYRSQGLGSRLLAWGIERARAEGRQIYLCASREGRLLYVKRGFVRVSEGEVVVEEGGERNWFMIWRG